MLLEISQGAVEMVCKEIRAGATYGDDWWEQRYSDDEAGELEQDGEGEMKPQEVK